jgi:glycosyltransferase involved in cell wall biosynthesis
MVYGLLLALLQKARGGKVTFDVIDLWPEHFYTFLSKLQRILLLPVILFLRFERYASFLISDLIFFCSEEYSNEAGRYIRKEKKLVRYIGTDFDDYANVVKRKNNKSKVCSFLYAGTFGESYDVQSLVDAVAALIDEGYDFEICFAGDGPLKCQIENLAGRYPKYVRFVGLLGPDRLAEELINADVGLSCYAKHSRVSMPLKFYDYMSNHLYVINSLTGEVNMWLEELEVGIAYQAGNMASLKSAMQSTIVDKPWFRVDWESMEKRLSRFNAREETERMANELVDL